MASTRTIARTLSTLARTGAAFGLIAGAIAAQAAAGFTVSAADEQLVKVGMSQDEVRAAIGVPARNITFKATGLTTWTYQRADVETVFDVDFGTNGKVTAAGGRLVHFD